MRTKLLQTLIPVLILFILNVVYFHPALSGKKLIQDDILLGKAKGKEIVDYREATGEEPLWTNAMFSGMPTFQISTVYPNNWLSYVQKFISFVLIKNSSIYIISSLMIGMFFLLRSYKVDPWLSVGGAVAIGFSAFFIISLAAGHNAKIRTAVYIAPTLIGILLTLKGKHLLGFALTALMLGLNIQSNHFQVTFYTALIILPILVVYGINAIRQNEVLHYAKRCAFLLAAAIVGLGPNIGNLWSTLSYTQETMRGGHTALISDALGNETKENEGLSFDYAMAWSMTKAETFNLFIPMFAGGGIDEDYSGTAFFKSKTGGQSLANPQKEQFNALIGSTLYWGESMTNGAYYMGSIALFMFILGLALVKGPTRQWVIASILIALMFAWGKHFEFFNRIVFDYLPFYNKFRVPSYAVVILCILVPFFGFLGLQEFLNLASKNKEAAKKALFRVFYITGGIALFVAFLGPVLFDLSGSKDEQMLGYWQQYGMPLSLSEIEDARASIMRNSAFTSFVFVGLTFTALFFFLKGRLNTKALSIVVLALILIDLWSFDKDHLNSDSFVDANNYLSEFTMTQADEAILQDSDPHFRVWNTTQGLTGDSRTSFYHKSIGGYHGAKLARYQDLIDSQLSKNNRAAFDMLNAKYFIIQNQQNGMMQAMPNTSAAGNAWFPKNAIWASDAIDEMNKLSDFNATDDVIIHSDKQSELASTVFNDSLNKNEILLTSYDPKVMSYAAKVVNKPSLAVFSEIWYDAPGQPWKLYIDGKETELHRVNYLLRSAVIPVGEHELVMRFEPKTYYLGEKIDLIFSILLLIVVLGALFQELRGQKVS